MSAPSKPIKVKPAMNVYDDTDDDDLSDISERSHEEDISEPSPTKNLQTITGGSTDDKKYKTDSDSSRTPKAGLFTPESTVDDKNQNKKQGLTRTSSDEDQRLITATAAPVKTVVQARRIEQSDSEDTSATDSQLAKQSGAELFYSPDGSVVDANENDESKTNTLGQRDQNQSNQVKPSDNKQNEYAPKSLNQQKYDDDTDEDQTSDEESSSESQKTPVPVGKMAFGEPYTYIARFYTV